jgi:hypothetical protein
VRTWWRAGPDGAALKDQGLEVVLLDAAALTEIDSALLLPGRIPGLWKGDMLQVSAARAHFSGGVVAKVDRGGYEELISIPKAASNVVDAAILDAVREGQLWLTSGPASLWQEEVPTGVLTGEAVLRAAPAAIGAPQLLPGVLPDAWKDETSTAEGLAVMLAQKQGATLPWPLVRATIDGALRARLVELAPESGPWPCEFAAARSVKLRIPAHKPLPLTSAGAKVARAELRPNEIQDLAEVVPDLTRLAAGQALKFRIEIQIGGDSSPPAKVVDEINATLASVSEKLKLE